MTTVFEMHHVVRGGIQDRVLGRRGADIEAAGVVSGETALAMARAAVAETAADWGIGLTGWCKKWDFTSVSKRRISARTCSQTPNAFVSTFFFG